MSKSYIKSLLNRTDEMDSKKGLPLRDQSSSNGGSNSGSKGVEPQDLTLHALRTRSVESQELGENASTGYRTYKRRWIGLAQLTLMNIIVSWDWLTYAPVANHAAAYYDVSESTINWISTAFFLAFVFVFPITIAVLHRSLRAALLIAAVLVLIGNWIRYAGSTREGGGSIAHAMAGEIVIGFAQPFVLAAPTKYSDTWFTSRGRVAATAVMSLANPLGAALGQLIIPFWVSKPADISNMVLRVSIMSTVCAVPALLVPTRPPTPVGPSSETPKLNLRDSFGALFGSLEVWLLLIPFAVYVGLFNSASSLLFQMMGPYGFTNDEAGIGGAVLIGVGLVTAAITSPVLDRTKSFLLAIRLLVPVVALGYLAFTWMPETRTIEGPYVVLAILGASSFALVPVALECLIELSHPLGPEVTSTTAWAGGQLLGALFIIISDALVAGPDANPPRHMKKALIFQAVVALVVALVPLTLGLFGRRSNVNLRRIATDDGMHRRPTA